MAPVEIEDSEVTPQPLGFTVLSQKVELDISFSPKVVRGKTEIIIQPAIRDLRTIQLNCRQLIPTSVRVEGRVAGTSYGNLYQRLGLYATTGIYQYHFPKNRIARHTAQSEEELHIYVPPSVQVKEIDAFTAAAQEALQGQNGRKDGLSNGILADTPTMRNADYGGSSYAPIKIEIEYIIREFRDGFQFAGMEDGDARYPHIYTRNSPYPGIASCIFPCVDDSTARCNWEFSIRCPRTLGDIYTKPQPTINGVNGRALVNGLANGIPKADSVMSDGDDDLVDFTEEEKSLDISVICSGDMTDEIVDTVDPTRKTVSFRCDVPVLPQHIGFTIGPFEHVDLSDYRDSEDDERLGSNAVRVHGFCLPGRADEVRNSAMMLARAMDRFTDKYLTYPFTSYKLCFVDDLPCDVAHTASFSICSNRLLFPEQVWEPLDSTTRTLVHALASQWMGVNIIPQQPTDSWIIIGGSWFMTDLYLRELFGRNDFRFRQKMMCEQVVQLDARRPSIYTLGEYLPLDPGEIRFLELKAPLVLFILHHRLVKQSGKNGVDRCFWRLLLNARTGKYPNNAISTDTFFEVCEKVGHLKLETFFKQWVYGSGCPHFECYTSFNKKKLVVNLTIKQVQNDPTLKPPEKPLTSIEFMREAKEYAHGVPHETSQNAFVGPMTIRIHEADGTPYEHIVEINSSNTKVEIPYNTKYKRLKRSRRQKERAAAAQGIDVSGDAQDEVTLYMLGDVLGSAEDTVEWRLDDWSPEDDAKMEQESYEWLRVDADFEWICNTHINDMPSYMYVSQLQQDKDVVAQVESIRYLSLKEGHPLISSFMVKTLMDSRYFHGIRRLAAEVLPRCANERLDWIGLFHLQKAFQTLFCIPGSPMTQQNDFSDRSSYIIQCAIPQAIAKIKDLNGKAPIQVKRFLLDTIRYNDNRGNGFSDDFYMATLMSCLAESLVTLRPTTSVNEFSYEEEADEIEFQRKALEELGRQQRIDEWIPSFQNIYTTTALDCSLLLMKHKVIPAKPSEFMQYVRVGNSDQVRLKAWECLINLGMIKNDAVLKLLAQSIESESSPYFRNELLLLFNLSFGQIALLEAFDLKKLSEEQEQAAGLIIEQEQEGPTDREALLTRKSSIEGAIAGLKSEQSGREPLQQALAEALRSKTTSVRDVSELLELCGLLYESYNQLRVELRYPRYWRTEHVGNARMRFYHINKYRLKPITVPSAPPKEKGPKLTFKKPTISLKMKTPLEAPQGLERANPIVRDNITVSPQQTRTEPPLAVQPINSEPPILQSPPQSLARAESFSIHTAQSQTPRVSDPPSPAVAITPTPPTDQPSTALAAPPAAPTPQPKPEKAPKGPKVPKASKAPKPSKASSTQKTSRAPKTPKKGSRVVILKVAPERLKTLKDDPTLFRSQTLSTSSSHTVVDGPTTASPDAMEWQNSPKSELSVIAVDTQKNKKRRAESDKSDRPLKRQASTDPINGGRKSLIVKLKMKGGVGSEASELNGVNGPSTQ